VSGVWDASVNCPGPVAFPRRFRRLALLDGVACALPEQLGALLFPISGVNISTL